jgi:hypothetical protein
MTVDTFGQVNWLAVIVAAIAYFALGAVVYMPSTPISRAWQKATAMQMRPEQPSPSPLFYAGPLVAYFVAAAATAALARATATDTFGEAIVLGLVVGIGYAVMSWFIAAMFDPQKPQPWVWFAINSGYHLVGLLVVAVIVSLWR